MPTIRPATAEDVPHLVAMINRFAAANIMLPRTEAAVLRTLGDWLVITDEASDAPNPQSLIPNPPAILACGAVVALSDQLAEVRSLAVHESQQGQGLGGVMVNALLQIAKERDFRQVCALTLRENFFVRLGFRIVDRWSISPKLWQECIYCPKFHRCDEVAVLMDIAIRPGQSIDADTARPAAWNSLLKYPAWQPLKLAYYKKEEIGRLGD
ncbi:MAG: GNAT family N-acetyltransferase [Caldilineaceae bacterium]|nr:GNAT family N-acetyltransferase [Caldilineaceae bacterium]MBP8107494.1 GNAT family N-acetyltransferase [Caldilineaceae bacterium]MBP8123007.1 GNAT family N-acetyltransferase [Caldilineaceae bacterium]MBP9073685.1 GNAT family N-acetyltransferase [Caldilineaceae bacterium]